MIFVESCVQKVGQRERSSPVKHSGLGSNGFGRIDISSIFYNWIRGGTGCFLSAFSAKLSESANSDNGVIGRQVFIILSNIYISILIVMRA